MKKNGLICLAALSILTLSGCNPKTNAEKIENNNNEGWLNSYSATINNLLKEEDGKATIEIKKITDDNVDTIDFNSYHQPEADYPDEHVGQYFYQINLDFGENYYKEWTSEVYVEGFAEKEDVELSIDVNDSYITNLGFSRINYNELFDDAEDSDLDRPVLNADEVEYLKNGINTAYYNLDGNYDEDNLKARLQYMYSQTSDENGTFFMKYSEMADESKTALSKPISLTEERYYYDLGYFNPENGDIKVKLVDDKPTFVYNNKNFKMSEK